MDLVLYNRKDELFQKHKKITYYYMNVVIYCKFLSFRKLHFKDK
jgi:hypothetical protein